MTDNNNLVAFPTTIQEGHEWVAAFRQPVPMQGMANLCKAIADCYGEDAKIAPTGEWIAVSGKRPGEFKPATRPARNWRVCEIHPEDAGDGGVFTAITAEQAAAAMLKRHPSVADFDRLYVWPDGETPGPDNLLFVPTNAIKNSDAWVAQKAAESEELPLRNCDCGQVMNFDTDVHGNGIGDFFVKCQACGAESNQIRCEGRRHAAERWNSRFMAGDDLEA